MIVHDSKAEREGWISTDNSLPEPQKKVRVACITILDWNLEDLLRMAYHIYAKDTIVNGK